MIPTLYLGDGLYASFDGFQFRLWTERLGGTHEVFLETSVLERFEVFVESIRKSATEARPEAGCSCGWSGPADAADDHPCTLNDTDGPAF